jgi:hypothetical protein
MDDFGDYDTDFYDGDPADIPDVCMLPYSQQFCPHCHHRFDACVCDEYCTACGEDHAYCGGQ